jgi:hypothetical protein
MKRSKARSSLISLPAILMLAFSQSAVAQKPPPQSVPQNGQELTTKEPSAAQRNTIRFACPDLLVLAGQAPEGWEYPWGSKKLKFKSAAVSNGLMICSYGESLGDSLTRNVPKGYQCQDDGGRNFECKRVKAPIKAGGQSDE